MILLIFLLLLVPSAWAELKPLPDPPMVYDSERHIWRGGHGYAPRIEEPPQTPVSYDRMKDCLAKMEQAMRAMEPFIVYQYNRHSQWEYDYMRDNPRNKGTIEANLFAERERDYRLGKQIWTDAKACWRQP